MDEKILKKGMRLKQPFIVRVQLRGEVYEWLAACSNELQCNPAVLIRGIIEDYFDGCKSSGKPYDEK